MCRILGNRLTQSFTQGKKKEFQGSEVLKFYRDLAICIELNNEKGRNN